MILLPSSLSTERYRDLRSEIQPAVADGEFGAAHSPAERATLEAL